MKTHTKGKILGLLENALQFLKSLIKNQSINQSVVWNYEKFNIKMSVLNEKISAQDPFNFDADPDPDPGSAHEQNGSGSRSFL